MGRTGSDKNLRGGRSASDQVDRGAADAVAKKKPDATDIHVGSRIRMARQLAGVSQGKLGDRLGVTFQQVQKYEKGINRVGASRLQQIGRILNKSVGYFYEGAPGGAAPVDDGQDEVTAMLQTKEGVRLAIAFAQLSDDKLRALALHMVETLAMFAIEAEEPVPLDSRKLTALYKGGVAKS